MPGLTQTSLASLQFVVCFSCFSLCTVKEILFYLYATLPVQFQQQLGFNTFLTSFFLTGKQINKRPHKHLGFSLFNGTEIFYSSAPCSFQVLQLRKSFRQQHLFVTSSTIYFLSQRLREPILTQSHQHCYWISSSAGQWGSHFDHNRHPCSTEMGKSSVAIQYPGNRHCSRTWLKGLGSRCTSLQWPLPLQGQQPQAELQQPPQYLPRTTNQWPKIKL